MTKKRRNPNETNEEIITRMNETLVGQPGIVMTGENRPKYVGTFVNIERSGGNFLIHFSDEMVLLFTPISMISVVDENNKEGSYRSKIICNELYIGDKNLSEIFLDEVEEELEAKLPEVRELIRDTGTFTGCEELTNKFVATD